jgi:hypothetical protein
MKKIRLLVAGLLLFSLCGYSQTVSLGVRGGLNGFVKTQKNKSNGSNNIGAATVMLGYAIQLK